MSLAVKYSEEQGKVTIDALKKSVAEQGLKISFSKEDMAFIDSPEKTLLNKQHTGAPSGSAVEKMVNSQDASVEKFKLEVDGMRQRMQTARDRCFAD